MLSCLYTESRKKELLTLGARDKLKEIIILSGSSLLVIYLVHWRDLYVTTSSSTNFWEIS